MSSKQRIVDFRGKTCDEITNKINCWLRDNEHCKLTNITNVDTTGRWTILAIAECQACTFTNNHKLQSTL